MYPTFGGRYAFRADVTTDEIVLGTSQRSTLVPGLCQLVKSLRHNGARDETDIHPRCPALYMG